MCKKYVDYKKHFKYIVSKLFENGDFIATIKEMLK